MGATETESVRAAEFKELQRDGLDEAPLSDARGASGREHAPLGASGSRRTGAGGAPARDIAASRRWYRMKLAECRAHR
eukprot:1867942-Pleurochrysis_carterae.AAC.1